LLVSELQIIGRSDDGTSLEVMSEDGNIHHLPITEELRSLLSQPRLLAVVPDQEVTTVTVKEIQSRLRSGESMISISRTTDWSVEKIEKFSGPIMQERAYVIGLALAAQLRREKSSPTLSAATIAQLSPRGVDMASVEWNTWRLSDGSWDIVLMYPAKDGRTNEAHWSFDLENRTLEALDDDAAWISGDEIESEVQTPSHGIVYPTTPAPRLVPVKDNSVTPGVESHPPVETLTDDQIRDGITKRLKIPSWDDIMFGGSKDKKEEE
jgi:hypothetical protein